MGKKKKLIDKGFGTKKKKGLILTGTLSWPDGSNYRGAIKSEKEKVPHGEGVYFFPEDEQWYEEEGVKMHRLKSYFGEFKNGKFHGQGRFKCAGKDAYDYEGEFKNGLFHGKGRKECQNVLIYEGEFRNDKMHGYGILYSENFIKHEGEFRNDKKNGKGKTTILKDKGGFKKGTVYEGSYKNDHMNGYFKITFPWGGTSKGIMKKGKFITKRKK